MLYRSSILETGRIGVEAVERIAKELAREVGCLEVPVPENCLAVARWAEERSCWTTAFLFAREAACQQRENARAAYEAGRLAIKGADLTTAETWLSVARTASLRDADWESYLWIQIESGVVASQRGHTTRAQQFLTEAAHEAERFRFLGLRAEALHGLSLLALHNRSLPAAELYVRAALRVQDQGARRKELFRTLAMIMLARGNRATAIRLLNKLLRVGAVPYRASVLALLSGAITPGSSRALYEQPWECAWTLIHSAAETAPLALLYLAQAAVVHSDWDRLHRVQTYHKASARPDPLLSTALDDVINQAETLKQA